MEKVELKRKQEAAGRLSLVRPVTVVVAVWTSNTARPSARWKRCAYVAVANQPFLWTAFFFFFRGEAPSLFGGREAEAFWFRRRFVRQAGLACRSFALFHFLFLRHFLRWTHAAHYCRIAKKKVSLLLLVQYYSNIVTTSKNMHEKKLQLQYTHTQRCS